MYEILIGRTEAERAKWGIQGTIPIGKHYIKMGAASSLSNPVYMDVLRSHVVFVCGKRGSGKSYTLGVIAEGIADLPEEIRKNLTFLFIDTMGIYWTMKYPNRRERDELLAWNMQAKGLQTRLLIPVGAAETYRAQNIPFEGVFSLSVSELKAEEWLHVFGLRDTEPTGVLIDKIIFDLRDLAQPFGLADIIARLEKEEGWSIEVRRAAIARFLQAKNWGIFSDTKTRLEDLFMRAQTTVLDLSVFATAEAGWNVKALVIGLIADKLFASRMDARRMEETQEVNRALRYAPEDDKEKAPLVWLAVDEAHEFLPSNGTTAATGPLVKLLREGRQPGISLLLASQQPGKIHTDVLTQSDTVIAHRLTAKVDTDALGSLVQSYMRAGLDVVLNELPRDKGAAIVMDDTNERLYPVRIRPRLSWHGGQSPSALNSSSSSEKSHF